MNKDRDIQGAMYHAPSHASTHENTPAVLNKRAADLCVLRHMAHALYVTLSLQDPEAKQSQPLLYSMQERRGRAHRIVIYRPRDLAAGNTMPFVGFIGGTRQPSLPHIAAAIERFDQQLVVELANAPGILSYSSLQLRGGNWYNFALFNDAGAKTIFHRMETHTYAAHTIAPQYYDWIRLRHGVLSGTLADSTLRLHYTRFFTFDEQYGATIRLITHRTEGAEGYA